MSDSARRRGGHADPTAVVHIERPVGPARPRAAAGWPRDLNELVRGVRSACQLTQQELARRSGVQQSLIARYESGRTPPTLAALNRLLDAVDLRAVVRLVPATGDIDAAVSAALAMTPADRISRYAATCESILVEMRSGGVELTAVGPLAAVLHGVPIVAGDPGVLLSGDPDNLDRLERTAGWAWRMSLPGQFGRRAVRRSALEREPVWLLHAAVDDLRLFVEPPDDYATTADSAVRWMVGEVAVAGTDLATTLAALASAGLADSAVVDRFLAAVAARASDEPEPATREL